MAQVQELKVEAREGTGKGPSFQTRQKGLIPAIIYGGDAQSIHTSIWGGRQGHMPSWEGRLSDLDRKILTLYLLDLRKATP